MKPNFFIAGAPKCGTTSMARWLSCHPDIYLSADKEPHYFSTDYVAGKPRRISEYESLFRAASGRFPIVGEASTGYIFSEVAVRNIEEYSPGARFLVIVRNPVEMTVSLHAQRVSELYEDVTDIESAWQLQERRLVDERLVPKYCPDAKLLHYGHICSLGSHVERLFRTADRSRALVLVLDDIRRDPGAEYLKVLDFLGLEDDGRTDFPVHNKAKISRLPAVIRLSRRIAGVRSRFSIPRPRTGLIAGLRRLSEKEASPASISEAFRDELRVYFQDEVSRLSEILNRDFSDWLE